VFGPDPCERGNPEHPQLNALNDAARPRRRCRTVRCGL